MTAIVASNGFLPMTGARFFRIVIVHTVIALLAFWIGKAVRRIAGAQKEGDAK